MEFRHRNPKFFGFWIFGFFGFGFGFGFQNPNPNPKSKKFWVPMSATKYNLVTFDDSRVAKPRANAI